MPLDEIESIGAPALLVALMNALGYALKRFPIMNWTIPWILMIVGAVIYPFLSSGCDFDEFRSVVQHIVHGLLFGGASVGIHQGITRWKNGNANGNSIKPPPAPPGASIQ